ncbi:DUF3888 domain-containing protein [Sporosarcina sp. BI001-red]|uniref:DUF3888 domain-containing protein n=1 Tax=Sporosarcina sp. BI001-red TaxID=2282866 RepID=UPI000E248199|nr:DUF3888 domain-containing protein [Sporosarcina sp. BI001-red]REB05151.1 DUF3888 domain-containing protein [Sporosarcina sp. BI001-red]
MKKMLIAFILSLVFILSLILITSNQTTIPITDEPTQDSEELRLQDMLMVILTPYIEDDLNNYYYPEIVNSFSPHVAPWNIEVIETRRVNEFRGFQLQITFEIEPTDGGHWIPIGKDRMTYEISAGATVKLINHTHLKTYEYPTES